MPTTITPLPSAPSRADPTNFSARGDAMMTALETVFVSEVNAVVSEINALATSASVSATNATTNGATQVTLATTQAVNAANSAVNAASSALAAASSAAVAGATAWVSGTTYAVGDPRYSPIDFQTYRRTTVGAGTTDPSLDTVNWVRANVATIDSAPVGSTVSFTGLSVQNENGSWVIADGRTVATSTYPALAAIVPPDITLVNTATPLTAAIGSYGQDRTVNGLTLRGNTPIRASLDGGVTWASITGSITTGNIIGLAYGAGLWMMALSGTATVYKSTDGISWSSTTALPNALSGDISYGTGSNIAFGVGLFVVTGDPTAFNTCYTSPDGGTWTARTIDGNAVTSGFHKSIVFCAGSINRFVAVCGYDSSGNERFSYSSNGTSWTAGNLPVNYSGSATAFHIYTDDVNCVVLPFNSSTTDSVCYTTNGGTSWSSTSLPTTGATFVYNSYITGRYIAIRTFSNKYYLAHSTNGASWTETDMSTTAGWALPSWNSVLFQSTSTTPICKVGSVWLMPSNTSATYFYSSNGGLTWSLRTSPISFDHIVASSTKFVGVNSNGTTPYHSTDGVTWTLATTAPSSATIYSLSVANNVFFIINSSLATGWYSSDQGVTWTQRTWAAAAGAQDVVYGAGLYLMWPVLNATGTTYFTSTDLVTWTSRTGPSISVSYQGGVSFDSSNFVVHGYVGTQGLIYKSTDGITWGSQINIVADSAQPVAIRSLVCLSSSVYIASTNVNCHGTINGGTSWTALTTTPWGGGVPKVALDGELYSRFSSNGWIYRTKAKDFSDYEILMPSTQIAKGTITSVGNVGNAFVVYDNTNEYRRTTDGSTWTVGLNNSGVAANYARTFVVSNGTTMTITTTTGWTYQTTDGLSFTRVSSWYDNTAPTVMLFANGVYLKSHATRTNIMRSTDGVNYTVAYSNLVTNYAISGLAYVNGTYFAIGGNRVFTSPDSITWTLQAQSLASIAGTLTAEYKGGLYILCGSNGGCWTSPDLVTWTRRTSFSGRLYSTSASHLAIRDSSTNTAESTDNGLTWTTRVLTGVTSSVNAKAWGDMVIDTNGSILYASKQGVAFQTTGLTVPTTFPKIVEQGIYMYAYTDTNTYRLAKSSSLLKLPTLSAEVKLIRIR